MSIGPTRPCETTCSFEVGGGEDDSMGDNNGIGPRASRIDSSCTTRKMRISDDFLIWKINFVAKYLY